MIPKEKAEELVGKFIPYVRLKMGQEDFMDKAKCCALVAIDEIISHIEPNISPDTLKIRLEYWKEVIKEIEKL